jgi:hypothetical protein
MARTRAVSRTPPVRVHHVIEVWQQLSSKIKLSPPRSPAPGGEIDVVE